MFLTGMSLHHRTLLPLFQSSEVLLPAGVCTSWRFPDVLMAAKLTYQLILNTSTLARPIAADKTVDVVAFFFPEWIWPLQHPLEGHTWLLAALGALTMTFMSSTYLLYILNLNPFSSILILNCLSHHTVNNMNNWARTPVSCKPPRAGLKFFESEGRVIQDENIVEQELAVKVDKRCMNLVQKIGNSIHPSISLEVDYPSQHVDGKIPILDLKVWVELRRIQSVGEGGNEVNVVLHEFYSKDVASKCVINARSALSWSCKRTILTQEVLRILLNCSRELPWETTVSHMNHMMLRLQYSGYDQNCRTEVVWSALKAYKRMIELDSSGGQPLYRRREWKRL